jgi:hypothetical protein
MTTAITANPSAQTPMMIPNNAVSLSPLDFFSVENYKVDA